jgi:hypothetical protein
MDIAANPVGTKYMGTSGTIVFFFKERCYGTDIWLPKP